MAEDVELEEKFPAKVVVDTAEPVRKVTVSLVDWIVDLEVALSEAIEVAPLSIDPISVPNVTWVVGD